MSDTIDSLFSKTEKYLSSWLATPGLDMQLFLSFLAIIISVLASILLQRQISRSLPTPHKYSWIATDLLPTFLLPFLTILCLVSANWIALAASPSNQHIITGIIKLAIIWLIARALLYISHRHFMAYLVSIVMLITALLSVTGLLVPTKASLNEITFDTGTFHLSLLGAIKGVFMLIVLFWGAGVLSMAGERWLRSLQISFNAKELGIKFLRITLYLIAAVVTLNEVGVNLTALTVFGGAFAVGLGFGLQKITSNFISGIILLFEKTIQAGI